MGNRIQGAIAIIIGGVGLVRWIKAEPVGAGAYHAGSGAGMLIGSIIFLAAGVYFFSKK